MVQTLRKPEIIEIARREGKVTVERLVEHFGVTAQTIRRDLTELAISGDLERVHGGAILPSATTNICYSERQASNLEAKQKIAGKIAAEIPNDCTVFLNIGTTTEAVADALQGHSGLLVVTNNINIAGKFFGHPNIDVVVTGGEMRKSDGGLVGAATRDSTMQYRYDVAVIGCSALHIDGDILDYDMQEVGVSQTIIERSENVILAADSSKFERKAPARIASLKDVTMFVTDAPIDPRTREFCAQHDTRVVCVE